MNKIELKRGNLPIEEGCYFYCSGHGFAAEYVEVQLNPDRDTLSIWTEDDGYVAPVKAFPAHSYWSDKISFGLNISLKRAATRPEQP